MLFQAQRYSDQQHDTQNVRVAWISNRTTQRYIKPGFNVAGTRKQPPFDKSIQVYIDPSDIR